MYFNLMGIQTISLAKDNKKASKLCIRQFMKIPMSLLNDIKELILKLT